ncbi:hypothetical protein ACG9VV_004336 [Vibrio alginolyticus]
MEAVEQSQNETSLDKFASFSWLGSVVGGFGFGYIALPSGLQEAIRYKLPVTWRQSLLEIMQVSDWLICLFVLSVLALLWGSVAPNIALRTKKKQIEQLVTDYNSLSQDHDSLKSNYEEKLLDCYQIFSDYCLTLFNQLKLSSNERISIYTLELEHFRCIGRFSSNEEFKSKPDRMYAKSIGVLGHSWVIGAVSEVSSPCPKENLDRYVDYHHDKYDVPRELIIESSMKSRAFCAVRVTDSKQRAIAVVIVESTEGNGLPFSKISRYLNVEEKRKLACLMDGLSSHMVSVERAHEEGF